MRAVAVKPDLTIKPILSTFTIFVIKKKKNTAVSVETRASKVWAPLLPEGAALSVSDAWAVASSPVMLRRQLLTRTWCQD